MSPRVATINDPSPSENPMNPVNPVKLGLPLGTSLISILWGTVKLLKGLFILKGSKDDTLKYRGNYPKNKC
jgi:hypothetical protein